MIPIDIHRDLKIHAAANDTTLQDCIMKAIKVHLASDCRTVSNVDVDSKSAD